MMNRMDNIISSISVHINMSFRKRHNSAWTEHKIKTEYTLWSIMEGNVYIKTGDREYTAHKGDAVLFYPEADYYAHTDECGCDFVVVRFALEMGNSIDLFAGLNLSGIATGITDKTLVFCDKFMQNHKFAKRTSFKQYAMFIDYISDVIDIQSSNKAVLFNRQEEKVERTSIQRAIDYISKNYSTITVADVAKHVHMNEKRFITNFKKAIAISPGQYIYRCKMTRAAELLSDTNMKVAEIANALGFADQYAFSKAFKRSFGESPSAFRENEM